jgi:cystathionine beta-synthase
MGERNLKLFESVLDLVGWTPLVRLHRVVGGCRTPVYGKCEFVGSVSDEKLMARVIESPDLLERSVESLMEPPFPVLGGHVDLEEATQLITRSNAACLVRENGDLSGIVTRYDVVRSIALGDAR